MEVWAWNKYKKRFMQDGHHFVSTLAPGLCLLIFIHQRNLNTRQLERMEKYEKYENY